MTVEPLTAEHEAGLIEAASDPDMFAWMPVDMASSREALTDWLRASLAEARAARQIPFAILDARTGAVLGSTWVTRGAWASGVNVETKLLLLSHAFENVGLRRVEFKTDARNERSRGALLAAGASFEGILRKHMVVGEGRPRDSAYYSVIDDEWPAVKRHLQSRLAPRAAP